MIKKRKYCSINVTEKCAQELTFISKVLGKSLVGFVSELSSSLMAEAFKYKIGKGNVSYSIDEADNIIISFSGSSNFSFGKESLAEEKIRLQNIAEGRGL